MARRAIGRAAARRVALAALVSVVASTVAVATSPVSVAADEDTTTLLVLVDPSQPAADQEAVVADGPGDARSVIQSLGLLEVEVPATSADDALAAYGGDEAVLGVAQDLTRAVTGAASDPEYGSQWALPKIGWEDVHDVVTYNGSAVLAVLDTGVDAAAPDLAGRIGPGWSYDGSDPGTDPHGHGTHAATIAAASSDDGVGIAGVADANTTIMPVKVLGPDGSGSDSDVIAGLVWATDHGADVALMPFAGPGASPALQAAIDYAWANGVILVAAAGNDGSSEPAYPAAGAGVLGVAATEEDDSLWAASNRSDGALISAPGVSVLASDASGVVSVTGTSASSALTAGAAATLRAIDPVASNATIVGRLARHGDPLNGSTLGNGRLDLAGASTDTSEDGITPLGAPGGGPVVGPFAVAVARTWDGSDSTNFNNPNNWTPAGVPTATDALTIPGGIPTGSYPLVSAATGNSLAASIVIEDGASLTVTGSTLAVSGIITNHAGGTIHVSGTGTLTVPNNIESDGTFGIFATATVTIPHDFAGTGVTTMTGGTMTIGRSWRPTGGSFTAIGGTVRFTGEATTDSDFASAPNQFFNLAVDAGGNPRFGSDPGAMIKISNAFTNANPTLNTNFQATFRFNGTGNQTISTASTAATFGNLVVDKPGNRVILASSAKVSGNVSVASGGLDLGAFQLDRATAGGAFGASAGTTVEIGGTGGFPGGFALRNLAPSSTVIYEGMDQDVGAATYGNLILTNAGTKTMDPALTTVAGNLTVAMSANVIADGSIVVEGSSMFGPTTAFDAGSSTHHFRGSFSNQTSAWDGASSTAVLDGNAAQTIAGLAATSFNNLTIDNPAGINLSMGIQVGGTLDFQAGNITTGSTSVTIRATGSVTRTSGHVVGKLRKQINTNGTVARTFEVGTSTDYTPVDLEFHGVTGAGSGGVQHLVVSAVAGEHPDLASSGVDGAQDVNAHWVVTQNGTWTFTDYDATFGFTPALVDAGADTSSFIVRRNSGGTWFAAAAGTRTPTSTQSTGSTSFSEFVVGEPSGDATTTGLTCPTTLEYGQGGVCTATVTAAISGVAPSGDVSFTTDGSGSFSPAATCTLVPLDESSSSCDVTYAPTAVGTGLHSIEAGFSDGVQYTPSSSAPATISVTPAELTITADDQTKVYGDFDPVFTFTYSGLTNGDTGTATPPTCTVVGPHGDVSSSPYPITCSGAIDPNYTISYVDGELTVTPAALTITADNQTKVEGDFDPVFTFTYSGLTNGDTGTDTPPTCTVVGPHETAAGSPYPITCSGAVDPSYTITYVDGELVVTEAATPPIVSSITRADPDPTNASVVHWTVAFSTDVTGVDTTDFSLSGSGASGASVLSVSADTGSTRTVAVLSGTSGSLALHLDDDDSVVHGSTPLAGAGTGTVGSGGSGNGSFAGEAYTVDKVGPTITIVTPSDGASYLLGQVVNADYSCTDPSGVDTCAGTVADGDPISTSPVSAKSFTVDATDALGNPSTATTTYDVKYGFTGFFQPINNLPVLNALKRGQAVPVKFSLGGYQGLDIFAPGYPKSQEIPCDSSALVDGVEETVTAGSSTLTYDATTDQYSYVWKTSKNYVAGTCRQLVVKLVDGTMHHANFLFK